MNPEIIIIGGGVIGTACAYFLSKRGLKVLVLERSHLGAGASGTTASIVSIGGSSSTPKPLQPLNVESYHLILDAEQDFERSLEIIRGGALYAAMNEQEALELQAFDKEIRRMGIDCKLMDGSEACREEPLLCPEVEAALLNPASYHLNPFRLVDGYLSTAVGKGSRVEYGVEVHGLEVSNDRIDRVVTNKGDYHADWVVVAGGAYSPQILSSLSVQIPIVPARGQVILTEACQRMTDHVIMFLNHLYIRQTASGNFYLGSHTEFVGFENRITLEKITVFHKSFCQGGALARQVACLTLFRRFSAYL